MKHILSIIASLVCLATSGLAQNAELSAVTDKQDILLGEQINLVVQLKVAAAATVIFPLIGDTLTKEIEVLSRSKIDTTFEGTQLENKLLSQSFVITSFDSGYFPVEPLVAIVNGDTLLSNAFLVSVQTVPIDTAKGMMDIKDIEKVPFAWKEWLKENWYWIVITLVVLALITWLALYSSKIKPVKTSEPVAPVVPPYVVALKRLEELKEQQLWQKDKTKAYYSELTDILRTFIEEQFGIPALEQTTEETIVSMKHNPDFDENAIADVKRLLFLADLVKFAKEKPLGQENEVHLQRVMAFVSSYIPTDKTEEAKHG